MVIEEEASNQESMNNNSKSNSKKFKFVINKYKNGQSVDDNSDTFNNQTNEHCSQPSSSLIDLSKAAISSFNNTNNCFYAAATSPSK